MASNATDIDYGGETVTQDFVENLTLIVPFGQAQAVRTAELWPVAKTHGLSLGDRACLALGIERAAAILTANQRLCTVEAPVPVTLIREQR